MSKVRPGDILPRLEFRDVSVARVDAILGPKHKTPKNQSRVPIDWSECGLAKRYPDWERFLMTLAGERRKARREGTPPHPAALGKDDKRFQHDYDPGPAGDGPSAAMIRRRYGTKY